MTAADPTIANLAADLDAGPWLTLKAMADRLEELGQGELAEAYRWLARQGKFPVARARRSTWAWRKLTVSGTKDRSITLPGRVYDAISPNGRIRGYQTLSYAYLVAALALIDSGWLKKAEPGKMACKTCGRAREDSETTLVKRQTSNAYDRVCDDCEEVRS